MLTQPLNLARAWSSNAYRDDLVGTGLGLAAVLAAQALLDEWVLAWVGG